MRLVPFFYGVLPIQSIYAPFTFTNSNWDVKYGKSFIISWSGGSGGPYEVWVTATKANGTWYTLLGTTVSNVENYTWTAPLLGSRPTPRYAIEYDDEYECHIDDVSGTAIYGTTFTMLNSSSAPSLASQTPETASTTTPSTSIPLTTTFSPPLSCIGRYVSVQSSITSGSADRLFAECQPWHQGSAWTLTYSPGMCPGPMTAVSTVTAINGVFTEICCQRGFTRDVHGCQSVVATPTPVLVASAINTTDEYTRVSAVTAVHEAVTVLWKSTDLSLFPADVYTSRWDAQTSAGFQQQDSHNSGQYTGDPSSTAKLGIIVGIAMPFFLFLLGTFIWVMKTGRLQAKLGRRPELDSSYTSVWKRYLGNTWRAELGTQDEARKQTAELEGNANQHIHMDTGNHINAGAPRELEACLPEQALIQGSKSELE